VVSDGGDAGLEGKWADDGCGVGRRAVGYEVAAGAEGGVDDFEEGVLDFLLFGGRGGVEA
jgi:hypothetical protein